MRIFSKSTLIKFWKQKAYKDSEQPLKAWYDEVRKTNWKSPNEVKNQYRNVSVIGNERLVFNIAGNKYRLIVAVKYKYQRMFICFVGTHEQYDRVNAEEIWDV